jgi:hypothetical protein
VKLLLGLVILAGCAAAPPVESLPIPPIPPEAVECKPAEVVPTAATPASVATKNYHKVESAIGPAVTAPSATANNIHAIDKADKLARRALSNLIKEDGHPSPKSIAAARNALDELIAALENSKGQQ